MQIKYSRQLKEKMLKDYKKYRLLDNMDHMSAQYTRICDFYKKDDAFYIKIVLSIFFYDNTENNDTNDKNQHRDKYWNDIWITTYKKDEKEKSTNCINCGAPMQYNGEKEIYECEYCGTSNYEKPNIEWELFDIEI